ncbi:C45 family autoproteolytic acyltransferase/hydolase [Pontibacter sp. G13]|uniref:C45 family autoproteolytic acyltransferase/hydolase n=1 Tax=Pontibacter sp. G13 TaxID=3074898 RepID=UPI0028899A07|nr:C45 family autoproteolytic acyltransferase/hydolase [Pontibacter sp. G13]WNJ17133.1 C45 family autoproteolytic acyltransferase/hydrolase [Pontibacter sp. G13]
MKPTEHIVNLDLPPRERWGFLVDYKTELDALLECYLSDFQGAGFEFDGIEAYKNEIISSDYIEEIEFISSISKFTPNEILIANLYYDLLKFYLGCTAFAFETNGTVLHARNLDWWTDNNLLSSQSKIFDYQRNGNTIFKTVGWVGFIGALSGTKPGKFSITLNAVSSKDSAEIAMPISFLLRDILDNATSFNEAKEILENEPIASDCLLLLSGTSTEELIVIERTPKRFATRLPENGIICVTNDYKLLENGESSESELQSTSCSRYDRASELLGHGLPVNSEGCFSILQDEKVMMGITVQQMVFNNHTGQVELIKTGALTTGNSE